MNMNDQLTPIFDALSQDMRRTDTDRRRISLVDKEKRSWTSHSNDKVVFNIMNPQVTQFGLNNALPHSAYLWRCLIQSSCVSTTTIGISSQQLDGSSGPHPAQVMQVQELDGIRWRLQSDHRNLLEMISRCRLVDFVVEPDKMYGIKLSTILAWSISFSVLLRQ